MKSFAPTACALALAAAFPAAAQSNEELLKELRALRDRVQQLEQKLQAAPAAPAPGQWGMTPEQAREMNRLAVKAESMQDNFADQGYSPIIAAGLTSFTMGAPGVRAIKNSRPVWAKATSVLARSFFEGRSSLWV